MKKIIQLSVAITSLILLSCQQGKGNNQSSPEINSSMQVSKIDVGFDSCMSDLITLYHYKPDVTPPGKLKYNMVYDLKKRLYLPQFHNLTFDLRKYNQSSHSNITVLHIYNDSIELIVPFIYIFNPDDKSTVNGTKVLGEQLSNLVKLLKLNQQYEVASLLDVIMNMYDTKRVESRTDIKVYEMQCRKFIEEGSYAGNCKSDIENNLRLAGKLYGEPNTMIYGRDMPTFIFKINNLFEVSAEYLNYDCAYR